MDDDRDLPPRAPRRCHGQRPSISSSSDRLRKVRIATMPASTAMLPSVGVTATVLMMSAATISSSPSRIDRPKLLRSARYAASPPLPPPPLAARAKHHALNPIPARITAIPATSTARVTAWISGRMAWSDGIARHNARASISSLVRWGSAGQEGMMAEKKGKGSETAQKANAKAAKEGKSNPRKSSAAQSELGKKGAAKKKAS